MFGSDTPKQLISTYFIILFECISSLFLLHVQCICPLSGQLQLWQVQAVHWRHDNRNWLPAEEEYWLLPLRLGQDGRRVYPAVQQPGLLCYPAGGCPQTCNMSCPNVFSTRLIILLLLSVSQLVFTFCDKLFGLMVKDIEAMDASILRGEPASGKKQKVSDQHADDLRCILKRLKCNRSQAFSKSGFLAPCCG